MIGENVRAAARGVTIFICVLLVMVLIAGISIGIIAMFSSTAQAVL